MTKLSSILFMPTVPLRQKSPQELDVIRRFLFEDLKGMDARHEKRWRRFWRRVFDADPGEGMQMWPEVDRHLRFHRRWMAIERRVFENQDRYVNLDRFRDWLKVGAGWGEYQRVNGVMRFVPGSLSYESASDDEMREFADAAEMFLRTPRATKKLWPHLKLPQRLEMIETLLRNPNEEEAHAK